MIKADDKIKQGRDVDISSVFMIQAINLKSSNPDFVPQVLRGKVEEIRRRKRIQIFCAIPVTIVLVVSIAVQFI